MRIRAGKSSNKFIGTPTIGSATVYGTSGTQVSVSFTAPSNLGKGNISYRVTNGIGNISATGSSSPIIVSGLTPGVPYTFFVEALSDSGIVSQASSNSNSVTPVQPSYTLLNTYTSSNTFTVPANITQITIVGCGAGAGGASGGPGNGGCYGGSGGGAGGGFVIKDYNVTAGQTFSVGIAGSGGTTSFGSIVSVSSASGRNGGIVTANVTAEFAVNGSTGAAQGPNTGYASNGTPGYGGSATSTLSSTAPGVATFTYGGSGGGGGGGGNTFAGSGVERFGGSGGSGGSPYGAGGGTGARAYFNTSGFNLSNGGSGGGTSNPGGGGGGGGGGAQNGSQITSGGGGGAGGPGRILVYGR